MTEAERERFFELAGKYHYDAELPKGEADWRAAAQVIDERRRRDTTT